MAETDDLKAEIEKLKSENEKLHKQLDDVTGENLYLKEKIRKENKTRTRYLSFSMKPRPTLGIDHKKIEFKSANSSSVRLLSRLFETPDIIDSMKETPLGISDIYDLLYEDDDAVTDWFDLGKNGRKKATNDIYQIFRRINDETTVILGGEKLFVQQDSGFKINGKILF